MSDVLPTLQAIFSIDLEYLSGFDLALAAYNVVLTCNYFAFFSCFY
jgi:hypothetical protein